MNVGGQLGKSMPRKEMTRKGLREAFTVEKKHMLLEIVDFFLRRGNC
jgi:hypothetical protein